MRNAKLEHTVNYRAAQEASMRIIELENRCTGNRTVGSNPTLRCRCDSRLRGFGHLGAA
jgi:hypothetical protein